MCRRSTRNSGADRSRHVTRARLQRARPSAFGAGGGRSVLRRAQHCGRTGARTSVRGLDAAAEVIYSL